jgi:hypothetical protein
VAIRAAHLKAVFRFWFFVKIKKNSFEYLFDFITGFKKRDRNFIQVIQKTGTKEKGQPNGPPNLRRFQIIFGKAGRGPVASQPSSQEPFATISI